MSELVKVHVVDITLLPILTVTTVTEESPVPNCTLTVGDALRSPYKLFTSSTKDPVAERNETSLLTDQ